ncbi:hypothetical protein [Paraferrimonas sedimenticola]|uniref:Uncharacterized protein n=1 Tax=Paraferrimonas sedimenticola TaxID=375674 RepID=A0AA37RSS6_9GAMM|nr:hypothetical protein [Paraferrimonas sedimenticola]GLP94701.1 hypothetical protein GCM10007895_00070 [Paraferrimonas sedimenticola]
MKWPDDIKPWLPTLVAYILLNFIFDALVTYFDSKPGELVFALWNLGVALSFEPYRRARARAGGKECWKEIMAYFIFYGPTHLIAAAGHQLTQLAKWLGYR